MMEEPIPFTYLNDFGFCPDSIYFHGLMGGLDRTSYQSRCQLEGTAAHSRVDRGSSNGLVMGIQVYSERFGLYGYIDMYDPRTRTLTERKNRVSSVYDGFVFQLYAQYHSMVEMGYPVERLRLHSMRDNRNYDIPLPRDDPEMDRRFRERIEDIRGYVVGSEAARNPARCSKCIYEPVCGFAEVAHDLQG